MAYADRSCGRRYANAAMFQNEMNGVTLTATDGSPVLGTELASASNLSNDLGVWANIGVLAVIALGCRVAAFLGLKLAAHLRWL